MKSKINMSESGSHKEIARKDVHTDDSFKMWKKQVKKMLKNKNLEDAIVIGVLKGKNNNHKTLALVLNDRTMDPNELDAIMTQIPLVLFTKILGIVSSRDNDNNFIFTDVLDEKRLDIVCEVIAKLLKQCVESARGENMFAGDKKAQQRWDESYERAVNKMMTKAAKKWGIKVKRSK